MSHRHLLLSSAAGLVLTALQPWDAAQAQTKPSPTAEQATGVVGDAEIIVTAERRNESLQNVPISVSAFNQAALQAKQIAGIKDLQISVPNVTFSKGSRGDNFQIRGIGSNGLSVAGDSGTGIHLDSLPLIDNRLFEMDFVDLSRVEVLRGPQGTLFGRNSTGGTINVIPAAPTGRLEAFVQAQLGNYSEKQFSGMINLPLIGDKLALRIAGAYLDRDGFTTNLAGGPKLDGRKQETFRATLAINPTDRLHASVLWQHYHENDNRLVTAKAACVADPGPSSVGGVPVTNPLIQGFLSQGCANANLAGATGFPNSQTTLHGALAVQAGIAAGNLYPANVPADVSTVNTSIPPSYYANENIYKFDVKWDVLDHVSLKYTVGYQKNDTRYVQDFGVTDGTVPFLSTTASPGGFINDPQFGSYNILFEPSQIKRKSSQTTNEFIIQSSFPGSFNFNLGGIIIDYHLNNDAIIYSNAFTGYARNANLNVPCPINTNTCIYIDPNNPLDNSGHNYYRLDQPYSLNSKAVFGEIYWNLTPTLKFTGGLRYTDESKSILNFPVTFITPGSGSGVTPGVPPVVSFSSSAVTGRAVLDWKPELSFTDSTLIYGSFSRGFKGGGPNNAGSPATALTFNPEFVNTIEIGTKNTLLGGKLTLNADIFYNEFNGYQYSTSINKIGVVQNANATTKGVEFEASWRPVRGLQFNAAGGFLETKVTGGSAIDSFNQTGGDPNLTLVKNGTASACVVPTAALANLIAIIEQRPGAPTMTGVSGVPLSILKVCSGTYASMGVTTSPGVYADLTGKDLPSSPHYTISLGAQYGWAVSPDWRATIRVDYYRQGKSYARPFNDAVDLIPAWSNINLSARISKEDDDLAVTLYVKNLQDTRAVTGYLFNDAALGLLPRFYLRDPRTYGINIRKQF
jgi:outer membrane receptor protein involved in Fe transport